MAKEQTLWNVEEIKETLTLTMVNKNQYKACVKFLDSLLEDLGLLDLMDFISKWLKNKHIILKTPEGIVTEDKVIDEFMALKPNKKLKYENYNKFIAIILSDSGNIRKMLSTCPPEVTQVLKRLLGCFYIPVEDLYDTSEGKSVLEMQKRWGNDFFEVKYPWFKLVASEVSEETYFYDKKLFITIPYFLYSFFYRALTEEVEPLSGELHKEKGWHVLSTEVDVVTAYPILYSMYNQNVLVVGKSHKMLISTIKKCVKLLTMRELFPDSNDSFLQNIRASFVLPYFYEMFFSLKKKQIPSVQDFLKIYAFRVLHDQDIIPLLIPHVKGVRYNDVDFSKFEDLTVMVWNILTREEYMDKWIPVERILHDVLEMEDGYYNLHLFSFYDYGTSYLKMKNNCKDGDLIHYGNLKDELCIPSLKGILLMLVAVGLLDVVYRDYDLEDVSWVDWLKSVRITNLGKYVFGLSKTYTSPCSEDVHRNIFDVDPDRLMLRVTAEDTPYVAYLKEVATSIGCNRFVFSYDSFLRNSSSKKDVENKIDFFKQFITSDLSPIWEDFFKKLLVRCSPLQSASDKKYDIYKVNPDNKELLYLLSTDEKLKKYVVRAEGFLILVESRYKSEFSKRLKGLGYML